MHFIPSFFNRSSIGPHQYHDKVHALQTPLKEAMSEIIKRRRDDDLIHAIREYLKDDIPDHFNQQTPVFYLSRHIATANYETLRYLNVCHAFDPNIPIIIGQDPEDIFVGNNVLKRILGKLPINRGESNQDEQIISNVTILDFSKMQGKKLSNIDTYCGSSLLEFHNGLLQKMSTGYTYSLADESDWVTRNYRGNLIEHYKRLLALLLVHGIMFEFYEDEDEHFVEQILIPAYTYVTTKFGHRPLITFLVAPDKEYERDWNSFPPEIYPHVQVCLKENEHGEKLK